MSASRHQTDCLVCGAAVRPVLDLNRQPLANMLLGAPGERYDVHELGLAYCPQCSHGQLTHFIDPKILFEDYLYASGTSQTLQRYFEWFAQSLRRSMPLAGTVLEIASNDGSLLTCLARAGFEATGIDPARNLNAIAKRAGCRVIDGFFPDKAPAATFDVVVAMNVAAHTPDPLGFMNGVKQVLAPSGIALIQTSQAMMLGNGEFDTIYHEHHSFFTPASMAHLAERAGLRLARVDLVSVHGTSMVFTLCHGDNAEPAVFAGGEPFSVPWPDPEPTFLASDFAGAAVGAVYEAFASDARKRMDDVSSILAARRAAGGKVALVGVAAKALTFIRAAQIEPDYYLDEAELKIGRFLPGTDVSIMPLSAAADLDDDCIFLVGAWNFAEELIRKVKAVRPNAKSTFVVHLPVLRIVE